MAAVQEQVRRGIHFVVPREEFDSKEAAWRRVAELEIDERVAYVDGVTRSAAWTLPACDRVAGTRPSKPRLMKSLSFGGKDECYDDDPI